MSCDTSTCSCTCNYAQCNYSIGYMREDGDFQLLVTVNDNDGVVPIARLRLIAFEVKRMLQEKLPDVKIISLNRQDAPDYVCIDEE